MRRNPRSSLRPLAGTIALAFAAQTVFSVIDDTLQRIADYPYTSTALRGLAVSGHHHESDNAQVVKLRLYDSPMLIAEKSVLEINVPSR